MIKTVAGILLLISLGTCVKHPEPYYGRKIGPLLEFAHGIKGTAYAVDESTIFIKGFSYDGTGPDAFFWIGNSPRPSPEGIIIPYPEDYIGRDPPELRAYNNTDIILRLPMGKRIRDIRWLSVWCRRFTVDFGEVFIPPNLEVPKPRVLPEFKRLAHGLRSDNISILDAKTFYIPNLHYDGAGPDAYFWVGNGSEPSPFGIKVPNEMGSLEPLRGYQGEDIEIQLPGSLTVYDIDWLAVWCVQYRHNFGHVMIPKDLDVPPALGQTKISTSTTQRTAAPTNCREFLNKRMQVRWEIKDDQVEITLSGKIREDQYMAFGISGSPNPPRMVGGDVVVAFYDPETFDFQAVDYYMSHTAQCDGKLGVCPDERIGGRNDVTLISGERKNGVTTVKFRRPLKTNEANNDQPIPEHGEVSVIAAFGPLNSRKEANAHSITDKTTEDHRIDFSNYDDHDCTISLDDLADENRPKPWPLAKIIGETTFNARIGPTGGKRGYTVITGHPSWGIAWYLNDMLIPEITLERGQTYTFVIEGGHDSANPARYHPFYITESNEGGFGQKTEDEQRKQKVYAGVDYDREGYPYPTAAGRYCEWAHKSVDKSMESETFKVFMETLRLECDQGEPAYLNWTVPMEAPDLLYYQCYTHNNLGWKIHIVDPGYISQHNSQGQLNGSPATTYSFSALLVSCLLVSSAIITHTRWHIL
ncbi:protein Skeletor, isoforms B/C isoform X1 [Anoplophora glabripennis]|uniref:protein Skeletor, isoforms B/C isoform X1 n=1 Tax=Anoplophora glabripennis TaxID=217634 RepID=UPI00087541A3|nr:protein Skeletor, isoforms B/C isoform X1 [Anoplophora glabripennis]XP_018572685.1 protein Skeletor, isoforms B/C isoform X1 [Anoplophora glabripennis]